ncbi:MAG: helix-turn-helix transcriptional regulator [Acutalibacteraceae bacterium]|nr:helix-turn-helix transcriptional regulator [Acutalibacteraceae bacterium]
MSVIGKQIKKYRTEKGITQEQLGQLIGVTTQAVSKWERGGTPDVELLPKLSQVLSVSIDTLFGIGEENLSLMIARRINQMPKDEAYRFAFNLCWAIENGVMPDTVFPEYFYNDFIERFSTDNSISNYFSKVMQDDGMALTRLSYDFQYFFLMKEPKSGIKKHLADVEKLRKIFDIFADKNILNIIFYMYSRLNTPVATSLISKNTALTEEQVDEYMEILCKNNMATKSIIETADGEINSYMFRQESSVIPLLCFADELTITESYDFLWSISRTKPLLK